MDVEVVVEKWGSYMKGDIIKNMPISTAKACIKSGVVQEIGQKTEVKKSKKEDKE